MPFYPAYTTTVVGAHSVPRWYEALDRLVTLGQLRRGDFADAQLRATQAAILEQESGWHRCDHGRRDAPANAQPPLAAQRDAESFLAENPRISGRALAPNRSPNTIQMCFIRRRFAADRSIDTIDLGLVEEFTTVSAFARKPVKITMTGPHLLAAVAYDEYYNDLPRMMADLGKLLHQNFRRLAEAGCKHIQIDEPYFTVADDQEVRAAVDAINMAVEGLPDDVHVMVHICQGNYAVGPDYDGQIGHRYFDNGRYKADLVCEDRVRWLPHRTRYDAPLRGTAWQQAARRRRRRCAGPQCRDRPSKSPTASRPTDGSRPSRRSSPAPAASIICRDMLSSGSFGPCGKPKPFLAQWWYSAMAQSEPLPKSSFPRKREPRGERHGFA